MIVQIHLQQNRSDLALKEVQAAKRWAQDSLLFNLAESWVGMRVVRSIPLPSFIYRLDHSILICLSVCQGGEHYQSAFYVYEELASAPGTSAALSIVGQAVAEMHLGRLPEAESALSMALEKYPEDVQVIANSIVLNVLAGKPVEELESYVPFPLWEWWTIGMVLMFGSRLANVQPSHPILSDVAEKSAFFDSAAAKYSPRVAS